MNNVTMDNVRKELECITNKCIAGNITVAVYDILKNTDDIEGLCNFLGIDVNKNRVRSLNTPSSLFSQLLSTGIELE